MTTFSYTNTAVEKRPLITPNLISFGALVLASIACVSMVAVRAFRTDNNWYAFMVWNLFLAWLPLLFSFIASRRATQRSPLLLAWGFLWLLFFPNAPYMVTDLVHLTKLGWQQDSYIWFDVTMFMLFALTGLFVGFASLRMMQAVVADKFNEWVGWVFVVASTALAGYGVVIGRFLRWNSWDIFTRPEVVINDLLIYFRDPLANWAHWGMVGALTAMFMFCYIMLIVLPRLTVPSTQ